MELTSMGLEYAPNNQIQLIVTETIQTKTLCSAACNQLPSCRIFDYDLISKRCRLFEGDSITGSIISSSSSTSIVGIVRISSNLYLSIHNQFCQACPENRYEVCSTNTNKCQCPVHTYWNGSVCALQLFENDTCTQPDACRSDLNLTCTTDCYGNWPKCLPTVFDNTTLLPMPFGVTIAGACNGSSSTNQTLLSAPADILLGYNNTLYVGDNTNQFFIFNLNNRTGQVLKSYSNWPSFLTLDNRTSNIYITLMYAHLAYIWPTNKTIPPSGISYSNCSMSWLYFPTGIVVDSIGNVYISSYSCHWITKWAPNAINGTVVAGSPSGTPGTDSLSLYVPYALALDESNSYIYVADRYNHRIQRFLLGGSGIGVTVAGGNGPGSAVNQLFRPTDIHISRMDGSIYIADSYNNRIQKWQKNATFGITVAGSSIGIAGHTPFLMSMTYGLAVDYAENYLYVSDSGNNRIQRFFLQ
ncbi:unnamed protein product [Rotaria sp. Silwood1]|nr:unnamed protein product [Rotaria sp. Silwood1]CAF1506905.1 unnamed protein product [Rotaria sp. Silwood1]CAF1507850.1 unnamed protein product [Rotaria sp. Silwood1]CAF3645954.1 unnamed protein product [Rotaria sp. Silwood1]CAF3723610.1 unnamed protein product [Rotaria sp. Silwood1]